MTYQPRLYREWLASLQPGDPVAVESGVLVRRTTPSAVQRRTATLIILRDGRRFGANGRERGGGNAGPVLVRPREG